ncbi:MAG: division/cell wall cluster transcriptional repressor MraZ [Bdellovibrionota bacterium]|nr:MAG: division/cell wall cluster transcriptional repressor MraZ [Bdellovibrionota bacterium]
MSTDDEDLAMADVPGDSPPEPESSSFRGNFTHAVDAKGRVSLPSEFRRVLEKGGDRSVVLTNYISEGARCLEGFGLQAWLSFEAKLRAKSRFSPKLQRLENFYLSRAAECPVDSAGRILVPAYLRSYAGIEKEVTFTSSIHGFRAWDKRIWQVIFSAAEQALMKNPEIFSDVDI